MAIHLLCLLGTSLLFLPKTSSQFSIAPVRFRLEIEGLDVPLTIPINVEPYDAIATFVKFQGLAADQHSHLINHVCSEISCARQRSAVTLFKFSVFPPGQRPVNIEFGDTDTVSAVADAACRQIRSCRADGSEGLIPEGYLSKEEQSLRIEIQRRLDEYQDGLIWSPCLYTRLGLHYDVAAVTNDDVKTAYRSLSKKHHPDRGGDKHLFIQLGDAYMVLVDEGKRREYDLEHGHVVYDQAETAWDGRDGRPMVQGFDGYNIHVAADGSVIIGG